MYTYGINLKAHKAIAECEERLRKQNRRVTVITQNIDELHARAGSKNIIELHGENISLIIKSRLKGHICTSTL